jgi:predicted nuclease of restriction endonuclease-like (RecB) superfamily
MDEQIDRSFNEVVQLIQSARQQAFQVANTALIDLYWQVGEYLSGKIADQGWGKAVIQQLADYLQRTNPDLRSFSAQNLWRMRQFYEEYRDAPILSALLRELPWTHNLSILGKCKRPEEREFYLRLAARERWSSRELDRQITACLFERAVLNPPKASAALQDLYPTAGQVFKDSYLLDFLNLGNSHSESDLQRGLIADLKQFLMELGRDFCFVGEEYQLQVGGRDFRLDLLFFHRELQCLVAFELKIDEFQPEYLGKLAFYLEALDRDMKKPHENPSIGVLLCAGKDSEVVEYALNSTLSSTIVAEYQTKLPDRTLLKRKLAEFYALEMTRFATE